MRTAATIILVLLISLNLSAQEINQTIKDTKTGNDILYGEVTREGLQQFGEWFDLEYNAYQPNETMIAYLKESHQKLPYLFIVLATWCGDSREHVPHFFKIADMIGYPADKIFMLAVDREKQAGDFCLADFNIQLVPTFIFTAQGEEKGRIIESPITSLEEDMLSIINH